MMLRLLPLIGFAALAACSYLPAVGPNYKPVKMDLPESYINMPQGTVSSTLLYWQRLNDPVLDDMVHQALAQNLTLKQTWQRLKAARAQAGMASAGLGPQLAAQGGYTGTRYGAENNPVTPVQQTIDTYAAGVGAVWEFDLFGANRRGTEAARAYADMQAAQSAGVRSSVVAEVTRQYLAYRTLQNRVALADAETAAAADMATLANHQHEAGAMDGLMLAKIQAQANQIAMQKPLLESALASTQYALESLLGQKPGTLAETLRTQPNAPTALPDVPALTELDLPSQMIRQRPDMMAADRRVAATTAEIGVATADLFPHFSLSGAYGVQAPDMGRFDSPEALTWHGGLQFRWALFSTGKILNNIAFSKARQREAVAAYQQAALDALADMESRLKAMKSTREAFTLAKNAAVQQARTNTLANAQHAQGLINGFEADKLFLDTLQTQDLALQTHMQALNSYIAVYQALGL
jgi:NodT family efflux transporter outer membrane factor (OMF) lipoprotein